MTELDSIGGWHCDIYQATGTTRINARIRKLALK